MHTFLRLDYIFKVIVFILISLINNLWQYWYFTFTISGYDLISTGSEFCEIILKNLLFVCNSGLMKSGIFGLNLCVNFKILLTILFIILFLFGEFRKAAFLKLELICRDFIRIYSRVCAMELGLH